MHNPNNKNLKSPIDLYEFGLSKIKSSKILIKINRKRNINSIEKKLFNSLFFKR